MGYAEVRMNRIAYRDSYRYQLVADYRCKVSILPSDERSSNLLTLTDDGWLTIREGYAWDGPSGPTIDTPNFMRGSLVHDALYQMIRESLLDGSCREAADLELQRICIEDGMSRLRAWFVYQGVKFGGGPYADPAAEKPIMAAP